MSGGFDELGNSVAGGQYNEDGDYVGGSPSMQLSSAPGGSPPSPGTNSIWSTIAALTNAATGAYQQVAKTINSTAVQNAQTRVAVAQVGQPNWAAWIILALIVLIVIKWVL